MIRALALLLALAPVPAAAQGAALAPGAHLRGLDKISGDPFDLDLQNGETGKFGHLQVTLLECRYPGEDPESNAFAHLRIVDTVPNSLIFDGWMIADSPALSALDHHRYDVWVTHCAGTPEAPPAPESPAE